MEITPEQRQPGLKNPLRPEQVEWLVKDEATTPLAMGDPQKVAEMVLAKNPRATLEQIAGVLYA